MTKVFLTGGNGFIGKNLLVALSGKYQFLSPGHKELELLNEQDVADYLKKHRPDIVIHAANIGGDRKTAHLQNLVQTNLRMFFNLARCKQYFDRMIFFGSGAEYDKRINLKQTQEEDFDLRVPADDYGFYKYACSKYINQTDKILNLRIFGLFGPHEDPEIRFISNAICRAILGLPIVIYQNVFFDYMDIQDFVRIVEVFLDHEPKQKFFNIGTGKKIDLTSLAGMVKKISGRDVPIIIKNSGLNKEYTCDNSRLLAELPNFKFTPLEASIKQLFQWYEKKKDQLSREKFILEK